MAGVRAIQKEKTRRALIAVSYTHLDVYKRQVYDLRARLNS